MPAGVVVDAGGIGKGLAADLTVAKLLADGAHGALVSIGGDLAIGRHSPRCRRMADHPRTARPGRRRLVHPRRERWRCRHLEYPLAAIDRWRPRPATTSSIPAAGAPSTTDLATVTVIARSGWLAEAHATTALLSGSANVIDHLDSHDVTGIAVPLDGAPLVTADLHWLHLVAPSRWALSGVR